MAKGFCKPCYDKNYRETHKEEISINHLDGSESILSITGGPIEKVDMGSLRKM